MRPEDEYRLRRPLSEYDSAPDVDTTDGSFTRPYRERPGCLTLWLVVNIIFVIINFVILLPYIGRLTRVVSPVLVLLVFADIAAQGVGAYLILQWKRQGVQLLVTAILLYPVLLSFMGQLQVTNLISVVVGLGILGYFVRPRWDSYE